MVESDLEGPWIKADHAFEVVSRSIPNGERVFQVLSSYDDIRFFVERAPGYEPGDTLVLIAPILIAHGVDEGFLNEVARDSGNTRLIPGARETIDYLKKREEFYLISTSYRQYVRQAAKLLGVPLPNTFSTSFPIDELRMEIEEDDITMVREWTGRIAEMPVIEMDKEGGITPECVEARNSLDEFFWEILPKTSFSNLMEEVRPVGGTRKFEALLKVLEKQGKGLEESIVIGDSITDSVMLANAKEAGAVALSFNGNRYSIPNSNIAILSDNCWATAAVLDLHRKLGMKGIKNLIQGPGDNFISKARSTGLNSELEEGLTRSFTSPESIPRVFWVDSEDLGSVISESEAFRKRIRGRGIGSLG